MNPYLAAVGVFSTTSYANLAYIADYQSGNRASATAQVAANDVTAFAVIGFAASLVGWARPRLTM
jgi:hypothetical protein